MRPAKAWDCTLFPNPANNFVTLVSRIAGDNLSIIICDVNGRELFNRNIQTINYTANLDLNLNNGIYFITIINSRNERIIKKLVIAK